jgi:hypothetical protein
VQPTATQAVDREYRLRGRLMFGFGLLGWAVWGTTAATLAPLPPAVKPWMLPAGFLVGVLVGNCVAALMRPLLLKPDGGADD